MFGHVEEERVHIFDGKMGAGKTANAVHEIIKFWKQDRPVWVNFPIEKLPERKTEVNGIYYESDPRGLLSMGEMKNFTSIKGFEQAGGLFVLDEAYMVLNARKWKDFDDETMLAFTHVRKLHMTVIVIAQSFEMIELNIRRLCSTCRKYQGSSIFGHKYDFQEYEVNEAGEIIKQEERIFETARTGFNWIGKTEYNAYDTDHLFRAMFRPKTWKSALVGDGMSLAGGLGSS